MARHFTVLTAGTLYFLFATATIHLTTNGRDIATVWPANAVLFALLLSRKRGGWLDILGAGFVANIAANLVTRGDLGGSVLFGLCNLAEVAVATRLMRPFVTSSGLLGAPAIMGRFVLVAGLLAPSISGLGGAGTAWLLFGQDYWASFRVWFLSDGLGLLIFSPFLLSLFDGEYVRCFRDKRWRERAEAMGVQAITAMIAYAVFFMAPRPLLFMLFAPVMLATFRVGRLGTQVSVLLVSLIGAIATMQQVGPIATLTSDPIEQAQLFQSFLAVLLLTCLPVSADLSARGARTNQLAESAAALRLREAELSQLATTDSLTGVLNRRAFQEQVSYALEKQEGAPHCLVAIDLDHFKLVNDRFGHHVGDRALAHLASVLQEQLRARDLIGRLGGDEFMILLTSTEIEQAEAIVDRLQSVLRSTPLKVDGSPTVLLSMSCGIACHEAGRSLDDLACIADAALYRAKANRPLESRLVA